LPLLRERDGRVHTTFNQTVATTGRLSSADPNLQNVPLRSEWGQRVRSAFVPDRGQVLVSADYSQIELRVVAHVSGEPELIDAFRSGQDIHRRTAAAVGGVAPEEVTAEMRRNAKVVNFGIVYGLSDFGLARDTGMSREEARAFIDAYFATFASVTAYLEQTRNHAREWGYVETLFGRRRYIPDIRAANRQIRGAAGRLVARSGRPACPSSPRWRRWRGTSAPPPSASASPGCSSAVRTSSAIRGPRPSPPGCVTPGSRRWSGSASSSSAPSTPPTSW